MTLGLVGDVLVGDRIAPGTIAVHDGLIARDPPRRPRRLPPGWTICPGLVDLQVNGFAGVEVDADAESLAQVAAALPRLGVTAFCPTLVSRPPADHRRAARALDPTGVAPHAARPLGPHLEGPFLARARCGAHDPGALVAPTPAAVERLLAAHPDRPPAIVTLAPELPGALGAIARLRRGGALVAVGHTDADATTGRAALTAGARLVTHALNAMAGIESRRPSLLVAFLADPRARVGLIGDGVHVAPAVAALVARLAGRRLVLVSDAVAAAGAPPGTYALAGRPIRSDGRRATREGRLAGALEGLDAGPRTLVAEGVGRARALHAAAGAPRRALGLAPGLTVGRPADLVVMDPGLVARLTLVGGRVAHADPALGFDVPPIGALV